MTWEVGTEVIFRTDRTWGRRAKVAKVYKNGNVVFDDGPQQYRVSSDTAYSTMRNSFNRTTVYRITDELIAKIGPEIQSQLARNAAHRLSRMLERAPEATCLEHINLIEALMNALDPKP